MFPRRRHPLWFECVVAVALALVLRELGAGGAAPAGADGRDTPPAYAFWFVVAIIAQAIWKGLEVAGRVTLEVLKWSVLHLWAFARTTYNGLVNVGKDLWRAARRAWDFLESTYEHVIKPAWQHFWKWFDRARRWLEDVFAPVFKFLRFIRQWVLDFYAKYVRPILDVLGIAQKALRVLEALGVDWAKRLDAELAEIQRRIDAPFRFALEQINRVINLVNRIVDGNGLFQRAMLIRSFERDVRYVSRAFMNWRSAPLSEADFEDLRKRSSERTAEDVQRDFEAGVMTGGGRYSPVISELAVRWRLSLERTR